MFFVGFGDAAPLLRDLIEAFSVGQKLGEVEQRMT
jgi:hypothetical protein